MCYCPTPTLHLNLALTGDGAFLLSPQKTHTVWFISVLNYGDTENVLINHLLLVIPMSYPCHYTNLCPHKPHKHAHTHTHTHIHLLVTGPKINSIIPLFSVINSNNAWEHNMDTFVMRRKKVYTFCCQQTEAFQKRILPTTFCKIISKEKQLIILISDYKN